VTAGHEQGEVLVSAVVVNYRRPDLTLACLKSLTRALAAVDAATELIVIDNGSGDDSAERLGREGAVDVLELAENVGFAAAMQVGLERSRGRWILMLNNDATVEPAGVAELLHVGESDPGIGSVAAQVRFALAPDTLNSAGVVVDRLGVSAERLLGRPVGASERQPVEVFGTHGCAALHRREMLTAVGGFDPSFFFGLDDVDLAWRARMGGWRAVYAPDAIVYHENAGTAPHAADFKYRWVGRARVRVLAKNADRRQLLRYGPAIVGYDLAYVAYVAARYRSLAPLRGRLQGLREWRTYRRAGASLRRPVALASVSGLRAALNRRATSSRLSRGGARAPSADLLGGDRETANETTAAHLSVK